ncbi:MULTISPECIES: hypothetical protein [unclassified Roseobacter]|uniref:hypothetical protein n=1 Tax=unclassified Roseobacter TaxID=196798 RepID=UPI001491CF0A|nr:MULTISPECIES: hypothetical protein [unclassified Roseobacter]NNV32492.1 hypothetical protein [Roseobacter sp. HKCCD9061]NNV70794.1 hypothetical protein [Roseobacter sp. HKCCD8474]NNW81569.1 hypothetical protein [Roseobacter sp. HKCCD8134]NNX24154.1 hypothetical protein [Roseobacter sp. HKCCD8626]NNX32410.1 hypothetical protein [Roseobacter sp. HKCCD6503]NNX36939.1 hypothetical protein [Roseobacter sp. HKCCD8418]NNX49708.1 hypothetical protein [Roseobacter sp. HKCCD8429]NNX53974.1 hypothe
MKHEKSVSALLGYLSKHPMFYQVVDQGRCCVRRAANPFFDLADVHDWPSVDVPHQLLGIVLSARTEPRKDFSFDLCF